MTDSEPKSETVAAQPSAAPNEATTGDHQSPQYPGILARTTIMVSLYLAMFLIIMDQTIIATAIPRITDEFSSIDDIAWYGSAYLLTTCAFQLLMGKVYKFYPTKPVFLVGILIFEVGSVICAAAPNSAVFIVGRAIAGSGSSGLFSGVMVIMYSTIPLKERPIWHGGIGAILALGTVIAPLIGGAFTDEVTWRWCFYINLPIGGFTILVVSLFLKIPDQRLDKPADGWLGKIRQLDPIGNLCFFPGIVCLILALQWGGTTYHWNDARIIVLFILCGLLVLTFIGVQVWKQEAATVPPRLVKQQSIAAVTVFSFFNGAGMALMYYLPIWFQAVKGTSAIDSGIRILPMALSLVLGNIVSGFLVSKLGYWSPFFLLSSVIMPVGAGLISTFSPTTGAGEWIGYQIILGFGTGIGLQQPMNVVQALLGRADIATGSALVTFVRFLSSAIFLPVAENIFLNILVRELANLPDIDAHSVTGSGALDLKSRVSDEDLDTLLLDYNTAIRYISIMVAATSAMTMLGSVFVEWRSLKAAGDKQGQAKKTGADIAKEEKGHT